MSSFSDVIDEYDVSTFLLGVVQAVFIYPSKCK